MDVSIEGLTVTLGGGRTLDGVDLDVGAGEIVALVGPNGAGKTTVLRCMVGWCEPDDGSIRYGGVSYDDLPSPHTQVGVLIGELPAVPGHRVGGHLTRLARFMEVPPGSVRDLTDRFGVDDYLGRRIDELSTGMRRRVQLVTALATPSTVLLLDEPGSALDPDGVERLHDELRRRADAGAAVVIVGHDLAGLAGLVDRAVVLLGGRVAGRADQVAEIEALQRTYAAALERQLP